MKVSVNPFQGNNELYRDCKKNAVQLTLNGTNEKQSLLTSESSLPRP